MDTKNLKADDEIDGQQPIDQLESVPGDIVQAKDDQAQENELQYDDSLSQTIESLTSPDDVVRTQALETLAHLEISSLQSTGMSNGAPTGCLVITASSSTPK